MPARRWIALVAVLGLAVCVSAATARGTRTTVAPSGMRVISYYPADGGWTLMWTNWRPERYAADFAHIRALGANTVRVVVQSSLFGFPQPDPVYLQRLQQMIGLAAERGLRVQLTLFDWCGYGEIADIQGSEQWAAAVLTPYVDDSRVAAIELKNEIDPGDPVVLTWARDLIPYVRTLMNGATPVTVSVTGDDPVASLTTLKTALGTSAPDFYTLPLFGGGGETAYWTLRAAKRAAAPVPIWIGETGYPTLAGWSGYPDLPPTTSAREAAQAHYLKTIALAAAQNGLPPIGVWVLSDFLADAIPTQDPAQPKPGESEYNYGLLRADGSAKPAAAAVRRIFGSSRTPSDFNGGFEQTVRDAAGRVFPAEWSGTTLSDARLTLDAAVAHGGHRAAVLRSLDGLPTGGSLSISPIEAAVPDGSIVQASAWVRVRSRGARVRLGLDWLGARARHIKTSLVSLSSSGTGWVELRIGAHRPPAARAVRVELRVARSPGAVWFDDVRFTISRG
ncbi:MAG: cellulase family glycosylhydrolase [Gaiellaceae bacterium]